jgi:hypothetical protein
MKLGGSERREPGERDRKQRKLGGRRRLEERIDGRQHVEGRQRDDADHNEDEPDRARAQTGQSEPVICTPGNGVRRNFP